MTVGLGLLDTIDSPDDVKRLAPAELTALCGEIRGALLRYGHLHGGHIGSNLGVVEATVALHAVFDSPRDRIVFDVSHQSYVHKMLTGRAAAFTDPSRFGEVTGFTNPAESAHDQFTLGHTGTSISLACGLAAMRERTGGLGVSGIGNVVAMIGDGSLSSGVAFEGLNNAAEQGGNLIIVFNDNEMSIAGDFGGMYATLARLRASNGAAQPNLFEAFGFDYRYVARGNDVNALVEAFRAVKDVDHPVVVHIHTTKGLGFPAGGAGSASCATGACAAADADATPDATGTTGACVAAAADSTTDATTDAMGTTGAATVSDGTADATGAATDADATTNASDTMGTATDTMGASSDTSISAARTPNANITAASIADTNTAAPAPNTGHAEPWHSDHCTLTDAAPHAGQCEASHWQTPDAALGRPDDPRKYYGKLAMAALERRFPTEPGLTVVVPATPGSNGITHDFRERAGAHYVDTGITESHAVAYAAGLAKAGGRPVVATTASFFQRAYDQFFQEMSLNRTRVTVLDFLGGLSGSDNTHSGAYDLTMFANIPGVTVMCPASGAEMLADLAWATQPGDAADAGDAGDADAGNAADDVTDARADTTVTGAGAGADGASIGSTDADATVAAARDMPDVPDGPVVIRMPGERILAAERAAGVAGAEPDLRAVGDVREWMPGIAAPNHAAADIGPTGIDASAPAIPTTSATHVTVAAPARNDGTDDAAETIEATAPGVAGIGAAGIGTTAEIDAAEATGAAAPDARTRRTLDWRVVRRGRTDVAILALGNTMPLGRRVADELDATLVDPRQCSVLDVRALESLRGRHRIVVTLEDGQLEGGWGEKVTAYYANHLVEDAPNPLTLNVGAAKEFTDRVPLDALERRYGLTRESVVERIVRARRVLDHAACDAACDAGCDAAARHA